MSDEEKLEEIERQIAELKFRSWLYYEGKKNEQQLR